VSNLCYSPSLAILNSICQCIALNEIFSNHIRASTSFELVAPPSFALTVFRVLPKTANSEADVNAFNRLFWDKLLARKEILLTQTELGGIFCIRFVVGAARTTAEDVEKAWSIIAEIGEEMRN
jgi:aromatic-L-amino-acid/L-tryptophan decarboxylase